MYKLHKKQIKNKNIRQRQLLYLIEGVSAKSAYYTEGDTVVADVHQPLKQCGYRRYDAYFQKYTVDLFKIDVALTDREVYRLSDEDGNIKR